jgi:hypothetical protein
MGGTEAIGVLLADGDVQYYLVSGGTVGLMDIWKNTRETHLKMCKEITTLETYFAHDSFEEDDSASRYLIVSDSKVIFREYGGNEEFEVVRRMI